MLCLRLSLSNAAAHSGALTAATFPSLHPRLRPAHIVAALTPSPPHCGHSSYRQTRAVASSATPATRSPPAPNASAAPQSSKHSKCKPKLAATAPASSPPTPHAVASKAASDQFVQLVTASRTKAVPTPPFTKLAAKTPSVSTDFKQKGSSKRDDVSGRPSAAPSASSSPSALKSKKLAKDSKADPPKKKGTAKQSSKPSTHESGPELCPPSPPKQKSKISINPSDSKKSPNSIFATPSKPTAPAKPKPAPVIEAPKVLSDQEIQDHAAVIVQSIVEGKPSDGLQHFSRLPSFPNLPSPVSASLAMALSSCPTPASDPRPDWDRIVETAFNPMVDHLKSQPTCRTIPDRPNSWISLTTRLATALGNRGHPRYSPLVDSWCTYLTTSRLLESASQPSSPLHKPVTSLLTQLIRACASMGSTSTLHSLATSLPDSLHSRDLLRTLLKADSTLRQPAHFWTTLLDAHKRQLIPYPYIDESINDLYLSSFTDPHAALDALRKMLAHVNKHHGTPLGDYLEPAVLSPDLFATVLNLCREQDNRALVDDVLALAESNHVPWTTARARAAIMAFHCQVGDWPAAIDMFQGAFSPDHPIEPSEDMLAYAMVAFAGTKDHAMLDKTFAYALEARRQGKLVLSNTFMVRAFKAIRTCFGWQVAVNKARDMHAVAGYLPELVVSILQRIASEREVALDFVPELRDDSHVHVQHKVGMLSMHRDRLAQAEKLLDLHVPRFADNVEARMYMCLPVLAAYASVPDVVSMERIIDRHIPDYHQCELAEDRQRVAGVLFKGYALNNNYTRCLALWQYLTNQGTAPHPSIQSMVLDACGYMNRVDHLDEIVRLLEHQPWGGCDINVWTSAVEAYLRLLRLDRAVDVATRIVPNKGLEPNKKFVCVLLTVRRDANRTLDSKAVAKYLGGLSPRLMAEVRKDLRERGAL